MPNGEILERVIFDPANIRSTNAAFDPANKGKSALLGGLGGAAVVGGSMTPEEAQAGPLSAGARRIIDPRFSQPVAGGSTRKGVLTDLEGMETTIDPRLMNIGRSEALYDYEGSPYILTQSDRSAAGGVVTSVKGKEIDPVNLRGGRDFMFDPQSGDLVWASDPAVVKSMYKRALELRKLYGKDPLLLPYTMAPTGIDFATMPLDVMINYARQGMGRSDIKRLDEQIRKVIPSWKGVMNPEANAVFREVHGNKRKAVANIIDKQFRDVEGGLSIGEARAATSDAAQYMAPDGSIQNIGQIEISNTSSRDQLSDHPTYRGGLKGQGIGKLDVDIDARELMEDKGRELTGDAADIRALSMNHELSQGVIDEKLLRRLYDKQRPRIEAISEKFGVSIPIAAMALMAGPEEAQAGPISAAAKRAIQKGYTKDVYHGTTQDFDQIDPDAVDLGVHVGTPVQAKNRLLDTADSSTRGRFAGVYDEGANIMPLKARMNKTLQMPDVGDWKNSYDVLVGLRNTPIWRKNSAKIQDLEEYADEIQGQYYGGDEVWRDSPENREILDEINTMLSDSGYDSIMYRNDVENAYGSDAGLTPAAEQRKAAISREINALDQEVRSRLPQIPEGSDPDFDAKLAAYIAGNPDQVITPAETARRAQLLDESRALSSDPTSQADPNSYIILDPDANLRSKNAQFIDERGNLLASVGTGLGIGIAGSMTPEEAQAGQAGMGGMGVRSAPTADDEEAMLAAQPPAPTGGDLLRQANDEFMGGIMTEPRSYMGDIEKALLGGIMQTAGMADLAADVFSSLAAPVMSAPGAIGRYVADRYIPGANYSAEDIARERKATEDYFNYQPRTELGPQYGEQAMQAIGGAIGPYIPAIKKAADDSYILGAMRKGYDYLGDKEKELSKAMLDLSPI